MKAENTVMDNRALLKFELKYSRDDTFYWGAAFDAAIKAQAEISFKAGYEAKFEMTTVTLSEVYDNGVKQGRKEVATWLKKNWFCPYPIGSSGYKKWQNQLKDWGTK